MFKELRLLPQDANANGKARWWIIISSTRHIYNIYIYIYIYIS